MGKERDSMSQNSNRSKESMWKQMEQFLGTKLPELPSVQKIADWKDTAWVKDYVKEMLEMSMPKAGISRGESASSEVFETHNYVIIKLRMPDPGNPLVRVRTDRVIIETSYKGKKQEIPLPCLVTPRLSRASHKDGILQIKMRKRKLNKTYHEIPIRYL
jgi:HSP20 family molecular chaperone IbpA